MKFDGEAFDNPKEIAKSFALFFITCPEDERMNQSYSNNFNALRLPRVIQFIPADSLILKILKWL